MLKRLRRQFVCIIMLIVTALLSAMLLLLFRFTERRLENQAEAAMRSQAMEPVARRRPGEMPEDIIRLETFTLSRTSDGSLKVGGSESYDLSDADYLARLYDEARGSGKDGGVLPDHGLRFVRVRSPRGEQLIFADTAQEQAALRHLKRGGYYVGSLTLLVFFGISLLLARWTVKPVEKAWQQQRQFVADASHELKTPLTVILTDAELLQSPETDEQTRRELSDSLLRMARQMRSLVERLLELARSDSGRHTEEETSLDFSSLAEQRVMSFEPLLYEAGLVLENEIEPDIYVKGRAGELAQVIDVLLDNAGKYSTAPGTVRLRLQRRDSRRCVLTVETPGESLNEEDCQRVFERFYRRDPARSRSGGFGLGLSIAKELVEGHRGRLYASPIPGGNRFTVELVC